MVRFYKLWSFSFFHDYYSAQPYRGFSIVPFNSTEKKIKSFGLAIKEINGEFIVLYKEEAVRSSLLYTLEHPLKLAFYVVCNDNLFLNYSDIEVDDLSQCFFLHNLYALRDDTVYLHAGERISPEQKIALVHDYKDLDGYVDHGDDLQIYTDITYADETAPFFKGKYADFKAQYAFSDLLEQGYFKVKREGKGEALSFYMAERKKNKPSGVLELTLMPGSLPLPEISYRAIIGAKQVIWRYNIIEKSQSIYTDFNIYLGKHALPLKPVTKVVLGNGSSAFVLEASEPIVLREAYDSYCEVEFSQTDVKAGQLISRKRVGLPTPDINRIKISKSADGQQAYSDMYVYL